MKISRLLSVLRELYFLRNRNFYFISPGGDNAYTICIIFFLFLFVVPIRVCGQVVPIEWDLTLGVDNYDEVLHGGDFRALGTYELYGEPWYFIGGDGYVPDPSDPFGDFAWYTIKMYTVPPPYNGYSEIYLHEAIESEFCCVGSPYEMPRTIGGNIWLKKAEDDPDPDTPYNASDFMVSGDEYDVFEDMQHFGGPGTDYMTAMDQNYGLLGGYSDSKVGRNKSEPSRGGFDYWIFNRPQWWDKTFGGSGNDRLMALTLAPYSDFHWLLVGYSNSGSGADKSEPSLGGYDLWLIAIDDAGNKVWDKTIGGSGNDFPAGVVATQDGGFVIAAYSNSGSGPYKSEPAKGGNDFWILKIDGSGNVLWDRTIGGSGNETMAAMEVTQDGGFLFGGTSNSGISGDKSEPSRGGDDYWVVKTDASGHLEWDKTAGGTNTDMLIDLVVDFEGGIVLGGNSYSGIGGDKTESNNKGDIWIVKLSEPEIHKTYPINASATQEYIASNGRKWQPDAYYSASMTLQKHQLDITNTTDDPIYLGLRYGKNFRYEIPDLNPGLYEVELHFAEIGFDRPGLRIFSVQAEGMDVLSDYDIAQAALDEGDDDGINYAVVERFNAMVTDSVLDLGFYVGPNGRNFATVNGISLERIGEEQATQIANLKSQAGDCTAEGVRVNLTFEMNSPDTFLVRNVETQKVMYSGHAGPGSSVAVEFLIPIPFLTPALTLEVVSGVPGQETLGPNTASLQLPVCVSPFTARINANGPEDYLASDNNLFVEDTLFDGGGMRNTTARVDNTQDDILFLTERFGKDFAYRIPVEEAGIYAVDLYWAETRFHRSNFRVFNVYAEGKPMLTSYDIYLEALRATGGAQGMNYALIESFNVEVADGTLDLDFVAKKNHAKVNAISVRPAVPDQELSLRAEGDPDLALFDPVSDLRLLPNFPNPFREATTIGFVLPESDEVSLRFFDLNGKMLGEIRRIFPAGLNQVEVGSDQLTQIGVLVYQLEFKGHRLSGRMLRLE